MAERLRVNPDEWLGVMQSPQVMLVVGEPVVH